MIRAKNIKITDKHITYIKITTGFPGLLAIHPISIINNQRRGIGPGGRFLFRVAGDHHGGMEAGALRKDQLRGCMKFGRAEQGQLGKHMSRSLDLEDWYEVFMVFYDFFCGCFKNFHEVSEGK